MLSIVLPVSKISKIDISKATDSLHHIADHIVSVLPNLAIACVVFVLFALAAAVAKRMVRRTAKGRHQALSILLGQLTHLSVLVLGVLVVLPIVAPSFRVANIISILGIGSVAIGFAFQNILQNFLAGILLLLNEPFQIGDAISVNGMEGRVDDIQARATVITMADGRYTVIPNATLFTSPVTIGRPGEPSQSPAQPQRAA